MAVGFMGFCTSSLNLSYHLFVSNPRGNTDNTPCRSFITHVYITHTHS